MPRTVSTTPTGFELKVTLSGGTSGANTIVKIVNRTTKEFVEVKAQSNTAIANLANMSSDGKAGVNSVFSGFGANQVLDVRVHGERYGSNTYTLGTTEINKGSGSVTVTVADISSTTTPEVNA